MPSPTPPTRPSPKTGARLRAEYIGYGLVFTINLVCILCLAFNIRGGIIAPLCLVPCGIIITFVGYRASERGRREVLRLNCRLCLRCRYPLPATGDAGVCPECGTRYT